MQGETYLAFIGTELSRELDRRDRINRQAASVIASSGTLLTLSTGVLTFVRGKDDTPHRLGLALFLTLSLYIAAAAVGLLASSDRRYRVTAPATMVAMLTEHWTDTETTARNVVGTLMVRSIGSLRIGNNNKSRWLLTSVILELSAVAASAYAIYVGA